LQSLLTKQNPLQSSKEHIVDLKIRRETGGGRAWGLVIHKVFEELVNGNAGSGFGD